MRAFRARRTRALRVRRTRALRARRTRGLRVRRARAGVAPDPRPRRPRRLPPPRRRLLRLPLHPPGRRRRSRRAVARRLYGAGLRERPMGGLDRADGRLLGVLLLHRHPGRDARPQLVRHPHPLSGHPAHPRQRLHHLGLQRADRQGRDGLLPEPARPGAGMGSGLGDAVRDVLRGVLSAVLGDGRLFRRTGAAAGVRTGALARGRRGSGVRGVGAVLPRRDPCPATACATSGSSTRSGPPASGTMPCFSCCARRPSSPRCSCTRRR